MEIKIQSIHFDATEKLQAFIEKKVAKLEKTFEDIQKVEVPVSYTHLNHRRLHSRIPRNCPWL